MLRKTANFTAPSGYTPPNATSLATLSARAFAVYWTLKDDKAVQAAGISAQDLAHEAETLLTRFPNANVNADERRRLRAALYRPLLGLKGEERARVVDLVLAILVDGHANDNA